MKANGGDVIKRSHSLLVFQFKTVDKQSVSTLMLM
jgi:hypothetical protein